MSEFHTPIWIRICSGVVLDFACADLAFELNTFTQYGVYLCEVISNQAHRLHRHKLVQPFLTFHGPIDLDLAITGLTLTRLTSTQYVEHLCEVSEVN